MQIMMKNRQEENNTKKILVFKASTQLKNKYTCF